MVNSFRKFTKEIFQGLPMALEGQHSVLVSMKSNQGLHFAQSTREITIKFIVHLDDLVPTESFNGNVFVYSRIPFDSTQLLSLHSRPKSWSFAVTLMFKQPALFELLCKCWK